MELLIEPGKYVVAVSGGVDSMVLLDTLRRRSDTELIVAHFDHGIRMDAAEDRALVQYTADSYRLKFEYTEGHLGPGVSEDVARQARYAFLHDVVQRYGANAIITAHHEDDVIETAIMNLLRGTGRKGVTSLQSTDAIKRPLLGVRKQQLLDYAKQHNIAWREDTTNSDTKYTRNYIRMHVVPKLDKAERERLVDSINDLQATNTRIDFEVSKFLHITGSEQNQIDRHAFIMLPYAVGCEVMAEWLRRNNLRAFDRKTIERLVVAACTFQPGQTVDIFGGATMTVGKSCLEIKSLQQ